MEIEGRILNWGNSFGIRLSKGDVEDLKVKPKDKVRVKVVRSKNPLEELFGLGERTGVKITHEMIKQARKEMESKWIK